jgi:hypothetical protein
MFLFRAFDTYIVTVLGGHPKGKCQKLKHLTTFKVAQQPPDNTCVFFVCIIKVVFGSHLNCAVSVSAFVLLYYRRLLLNMPFIFCR